jgi:hypothetical protein
MKNLLAISLLLAIALPSYAEKVLSADQPVPEEVTPISAPGSGRESRRK